MINYIVIVLHCLGLLFFLGAIVGINRLPDFFSRMHAASKGDTLSSLCLLGGFALFVLQDISLDAFILAVKILFIIVFIFISSPAATHALTDAAYRTGAVPWGTDKETKEEK